MGGDQLVAALIGEEGERSDGKAIRDAEGKSTPPWRRPEMVVLR